MRILYLIISITLLAFLIGNAAATNVTSKLQVHVPKSLSKEGGYDHREAFFGLPPYGASLQQFLYYADSDLCNPTSDPRQHGYPLRDLDDNGNMLPWPSPFILIIDRASHSGCTFVTQVRNAQHAGAAGVIIADNRCLCRHQHRERCTPTQPGHRCESREPTLVDDGSGGDITIPSFFMYKHDADPIKAELQSNRMVRMEMSWPLPQPDARVEYELWMKPGDPNTREFLSRFRAAAVALGEHAYFTPRLFLVDGIQSGCRDASGNNDCKSLCTNGGRYCAVSPGIKGISGADVVRESLRRSCAWKIYGEEDGVGQKWWDYVDSFADLCEHDDHFQNEECVQVAMTFANMDYTKVQNCMTFSGGLEDDTNNVILDEHLEAKTSAGVVMVPAVFVNNVRLGGGLQFVTVFKAICAGFAAGSIPAICQSCAHCGDPLACVHSKDQTCSAAATGASSFAFQQKERNPLAFVVSCVILVMLVCVAGISARSSYQRTRKDLRTQVRGIMAEYMPLEEDSGEVGSPVDLAKSGGTVTPFSLE